MAIVKGSMIRVVKANKKVVVGTEGEAFWVGKSKFGPEMCVGFSDENGTRAFLKLHEVEEVVVQALAAPGFEPEPEDAPQETGGDLEAELRAALFQIDALKKRVEGILKRAA
jgi:hypothetical protein